MLNGSSPGRSLAFLETAQLEWPNMLDTGDAIGSGSFYSFVSLWCHGEE